MALTTKLRLHLEAVQTANTGYEGGTRAELDVDLLLSSGTTAGKADLKHSSIRSVSASSNEDIDLRALTDGQGNTLTGLTEVVVLAIVADAGNGGALHVKPSASNGWLGVLADASDVLKVQPGAFVVLGCSADGAYPVGASTKSINVANQDSGAAASYQLIVIGRSA
jgi:hypothetical protein